MNKLTNTLNLNGQEVWLLVNHRGHYDTYQIFANEDDALAASRAQQLGRNALGSRTVYFDALATAFHIPPGFEIQKLQVNRNGTGDQLDDVWTCGYYSTGTRCAEEGAVDSRCGGGATERGSEMR